MSHEVLSKRFGLQFIIALLLVKSKPSTIPIQEYIAQLRSYIKHDSCSKAESRRCSQLDAAAFWRDAFTRSEEAQMLLRARIAELEEGKAHSPDSFLEASPTTASGRKRKRRLPDTYCPDTPDPKTVRLARKANISSPMHRGERPTTVSVTSESAPNSDTLVNALLHHIFILQDLKTHSPVHPQNMAYSIEQSLSTISQLVFCIGSSVAQRPSKGTSEQVSVKRSTIDMKPCGKTAEWCKSALQIVNGYWAFLLRSLDDITRLEGGCSLQGALIYHFAKVFKDTLRCIFEAAAIYHDSSSQTDARLLVLSRYRQQKPVFESSSATGGSLIILDLCDTLISLMGSLQPAENAHASIIEGCLYTLLTETGTRLNGFVFGNFEKDFLGSRVDMEVSSSSAAEAPYLVYILERTSHLTQSSLSFEHSSVPSSSQTTRDSSPDTSTHESGKLTQLATLRFQHTLLQAVFGDESFESFMPSLNPPTMPTTASMFNQVHKGNVGDWFKHAVWCLVGWDVLRAKLRTEGPIPS